MYDVDEGNILLFLLISSIFFFPHIYYNLFVEYFIITTLFLHIPVLAAVYSCGNDLVFSCFSKRIFRRNVDFIYIYKRRRIYLLKCFE